MNFGSAKLFQWTKEHMIQVLSSGKNPIVTDPVILNAFDKVDRVDFVPDLLKNQAYNDVDLDIGYSEKLSRPTVVAKMLSLLKPKFGGKYLDIGTGTGYAAAILAFVAGDTGKVYTMERVQWLWEEARKDIKKYATLRNIELLYRDGQEGLVQKAPFDGIHFSFAIDTIPDIVKNQLKVGNGILVHPDTRMNLHVIERLGIEEFQEELIEGYILENMKEGLA